MTAGKTNAELPPNTVYAGTHRMLPGDRIALEATTKCVFILFKSAIYDEALEDEGYRVVKV